MQSIRGVCQLFINHLFINKAKEVNPWIRNEFLCNSRYRLQIQSPAIALTITGPLVFNTNGGAFMSYRHSITEAGNKCQENILLKGDCIELMQKLPNESVQLVLTDPPCLVRYRSRDGRTVANDDNDKWLMPAYREIYRLLSNDSFCISFYGWTATDKFLQAFRAAGLRVVGHFVFVKSYSSSMCYVQYQHECAYLLCKGNPPLPAEPLSDVMNWKYTGNKLHPTQKPVSSLSPLIESFSRENDIVCDPFCGSGSTLVAAHKVGRRYIGMEIDNANFAAATKRLLRHGLIV